MAKITDLMRSRRSVRRFKGKTVPAFLVSNILEAGRWAPSGLNNQPWRFLVLSDKEKDSLRQFTQCGRIIKSADKVILVFLDKKVSYNDEKDLMAMGACIQNMLLAIHAQKLGGCWLGEILNQRKALQKFLKIKNNLELKTVIALGYPAQKPLTGKRQPLKKLIISWDNTCPK